MLLQMAEFHSFMANILFYFYTTSSFSIHHHTLEHFRTKPHVSHLIYKLN